MSDNFRFREHEPDRDERPRCRECDDAGCPAQDNRLRVRCPVCRYSALISPLDAPHVDCGTCGIPMVADARTPEDS